MALALHLYERPLAASPFGTAEHVPDWEDTRAMSSRVRPESLIVARVRSDLGVRTFFGCCQRTTARKTPAISTRKCSCQKLANPCPTLKPDFCHSALMWYLSPCFFSLCYYLATHKETLGCSVVFHLSSIFCLFCKSCVYTPDIFSPALLIPKIENTRWNFCGLPTHLCVFGAPEPRIRSGNIRNQYRQQTHGLLCILFIVCILHWLHAFELQMLCL